MTVRVVVTASGRATFEGSGYAPDGRVQRDDGGPLDGPLRVELERAGFSETDVERALEWLEQLSGEHARSRPVPTARTIRVFSERESARLDLDSRGYIMYLENIGILSSMQRELVIDRLLALDAAQIDIEQVKWVVLMVLFSQPDQHGAYARMEDLMFDRESDALH